MEKVQSQINHLYSEGAVEGYSEVQLASVLYRLKEFKSHHVPTLFTEVRQEAALLAHYKTATKWSFGCIMRA